MEIGIKIWLNVTNEDMELAGVCREDAARVED